MSDPFDGPQIPDDFDDENAPRPDGVKWRVREWFPGLSEEIHKKLETYHKELIHFNGHMNLISASTEKIADEVHFADCLLGSSIIFKNTDRSPIYDIGSGNGLPGIIMAILSPKRKFVLIDKDARKIEFLRHLAARLELKNVTALQRRLEEIDAGSVSCCVSRGFANLGKALTLSRKMASDDCLYYHFKGPSWSGEIASIPSQVCSIWDPELVKTYELPSRQVEMAIVVAKKI